MINLELSITVIRICGRRSLLWLLQLNVLMATAQYGIIQNDFRRYGPCMNYLNIFGYEYTFKDLTKDSLYYPVKSNRPGAVFIQNNGRLLRVKFFGKNGELLNKGTFTQGNGEIVMYGETPYKKIYRFKDGKFNDSSMFFRNGKLYEYQIFKNNFLVKQQTHIHSRVVANYNSSGHVHDSTFVFGKPANRLFSNRLDDPYDGKLYQVNIYLHGQLKELVFFYKDGSVKKREKYKVMPRKFKTGYPKACRD